jgi:hypothetical protein
VSTTTGDPLDTARVIGTSAQCVEHHARGQDPIRQAKYWGSPKASVSESGGIHLCPFPSVSSSPTIHSQALTQNR